MEISIKKISLTVCITVSLFCQVVGAPEAFFAPYDDIRSIFLHKIEKEKKFIYGAVYMFTDIKIAQALVAAMKRGIDVQIVIDQISMGSRAGKGKFLQEHGVPLYIHKTDFYNPYTMPLMHNKFFVFGMNQNNDALVWTGSWNCTLGGTKRNDENVLICDEISIVERYLQSFYRLKNRLIN